MKINGSSERSPAETLLAKLTRELFQTEVSAARHCRREADRCGDAQPSRALRAVAEHAERILGELPQLAAKRGLPLSVAGSTLGEMFSHVRSKFADVVIESERSYRSTLLGCRYGIDLVRMVQHVAACQGDLELDEFCAAWLNTRQVLVRHVEDEMLWFAQDPDRALRRAPLLPPGRTHSHAAS